MTRFPGKKAIVNDWFIGHIGYEGISKKYGVRHMAVKAWLKRCRIKPMDNDTRHKIIGLKTRVRTSSNNEAVKRAEKKLDEIYKKMYDEYLLDIKAAELSEKILELRYGYGMRVRDIETKLGLYMTEIYDNPRLPNLEKMTQGEVVELRQCRYWMYNSSTNSQKRKRYQKRYNAFWLRIAKKHGYTGTVHLVPEDGLMPHHNKAKDI